MNEQEARPTEVSAATRAPHCEKSPLVWLVGIVLWWGACWLAADAHFKNLTDNAYREESSKAELYVTEAAEEFQQMINVRTRLSRHLSGDPKVRRAFARFGPVMSGAELPSEERKRRWTATPELASLNRYLTEATAILQQGIVALTDAEGNCFAASNANTVASAIGLNYSDRKYMTQLRAGKDGYQVLFGKQSGQPGITIYTPVIENGRVLGGLLSRLGLGILHGNSFSAFMTDSHGVIVQANEPGLVGHLMTEGRPDKASTGGHQSSDPSEPQALLEIFPDGDADYPELKRVPGNNRPVIYHSASASAIGPTIHVLWPFPHRAQFGTTRNLVIMVAGLLGTLVALLVRSDIDRRREQNRHLHELEQAVAKRTTELHDANETLSLKSYAINHIKVCVLLVDPAGVILYANEHAGRSLDYSREKLVGMRIPDIDPEMNETKWQAHWCELRSAKALEFEGQLCRKDGTVFPADISANLFSYEGKEYNLGLVRNITKRKESEAKLAASERRFRTLVEATPDFIMRVDRACRYTYVNPTVARAFRTPAEAFIGKRLHELHLHSNDEQDERMEANIRAAFDTGMPNNMEVHWGRGNNEIICELRHIPEVDAVGNVTSVIGFARNITGRVELTRQIGESLELLRQLSAHRDTAREEERKHMAREIHDELGQVLTSLRMELSTLHRQFRANTAGHDGDFLQLIKLVDRTIQFTRNLVGALRPAALDMGLVPALDWLVAGCRARCGIDCQLNVPATEPTFDETQAIALFRITQEALTNATRYAEAQRVAITLSMEDAACRLVVSDDGKGFDGNNMHTNSFGLLGIRERALMLGGTARIDSAPGCGTTVEICIPIPIPIPTSSASASAEKALP